jgi:hypothetical protein
MSLVMAMKSALRRNLWTFASRAMLSTTSRALAGYAYTVNLVGVMKFASRLICCEDCLSDHPVRLSSRESELFSLGLW